MQLKDHKTLFASATESDEVKATLKNNTVSEIMTGNELIRIAQNKEIGFACNLMLEHKKYIPL